MIAVRLMMVMGLVLHRSVALVSTRVQSARHRLAPLRVERDDKLAEVLRGLEEEKAAAVQAEDYLLAAEVKARCVFPPPPRQRTRTPTRTPNPDRIAFLKGGEQVTEVRSRIRALERVWDEEEPDTHPGVDTDPYAKERDELERTRKATLQFKARNADLVSLGGAGTDLGDAPRILAEMFRQGKAEGTIDLHGQYRRESEATVEATLRALTSEQGNGRSFLLRIVVGRGGHSDGGKAVIKPAIEELLSRKGVAWGVESEGGELVVRVGQ